MDLSLKQDMLFTVGVPASRSKLQTVQTGSEKEGAKENAGPGKALGG